MNEESSLSGVICTSMTERNQKTGKCGSSDFPAPARVHMFAAHGCRSIIEFSRPGLRFASRFEGT